jgi:5'-nucleotidase
MRILCDIDSTVCDSLQYWLDEIGARSGVYANVSQIESWSLDTCPPLDRVSPSLIYGILNEHAFNANAPVMAGAVESIKRLVDEGHDVYFVTARHGDVAIVETIAWVKKHFPFVETRERLVFMADKHLIEADVIVDDRAETLEKYRNAHPHAMCLGIRFPYNARIPDCNYDYVFVPYGAEAWTKLLQVIHSYCEYDSLLDGVSKVS